MKTSILKISTIASALLFILQLSSCKKHECIDPSTKGTDTVIVTQTDTITKTDTLTFKKFVANNDPSIVEDAGVSLIKPTVNGSDNTVFNCYTWTQSGSKNVVRNFIKFDMTGIPAGAVVDSAFLSFYW